MVIQVGRGGMAFMPEGGSPMALGQASGTVRREALLPEWEGMPGRIRMVGGFGALVLGGKGGTEEPLYDVLDDDFDLRVTGTCEALEEDMPADQSLIVVNNDCWNEPLTDAQAIKLAHFVESGGGLVLLHGGISIASHPVLKNLVGASCVERPANRRLSFQAVIGKGGIHPAVQDIQPFELAEEPYRYSFLPSPDREVIMEYMLDGQRYPAAWAHRAGRGRIVVLLPGHTRETLRHPQVSRLLRSCSLWASGRI
ncbi:ThuA domain-containing protein [Paenibacillus pasadenensis]|uniref:ThuA domain-containing protein n=1 Tax=Paenibacillus pasadenensis TaxID=217090 RepID=UPI00203A5E13|nr:ThuA domain-containing protein [Paenibacillus pasadenensis]MCM3748676.1 ThuA domain-containing protein [Paenibacillus pasadenensis]